jgi:hypothetical protein
MVCGHQLNGLPQYISCVLDRKPSRFNRPFAGTIRVDRRHIGQNANLDGGVIRIGAASNACRTNEAYD